LEALDFIWTQGIIRPMLNTLVVLYVISFSNMGVAIILFTLLVRLVTLPLTVRQVKQMRAMSGLQPKLRGIQQRYARDRSRISRETMAAYKEAGVSPIGCIGPLVIQMPILLGLFRVLIQTLFSKPDDLVGLSEKLYSWLGFFPIYQAAPLSASFLGMDLAESPVGATVVIIPVLVFVSSWVQQKMTMTPATDAKQQGNQTMMLWMMPLLIAVFSFSFPTGLAMYWVVSNVVGVGIQYFITGWQPLFPLFPKPAEATEPPLEPFDDEPSEERTTNGSTSDDRPQRRRSNRVGPERARRRPRRGRGRSTK
jgi:YidC/Oxa1 family membrane protein insertase